MLIRVNGKFVTIECNECAIVYEVPLDSLVAGSPPMLDGLPGDVNSVSIPPCENCGAKELMIRTFDNTSAHALLANSLFAELCRQGKIHPSCNIYYACDDDCDASAGKWCGCCLPKHAVLLGEDDEIGLYGPAERDKIAEMLDQLIHLYHHHKDKQIPLPMWFKEAGHERQLREKGLI